ncbi:uncharacterized protein [Bemisia tabaci]|uniref:uncharacterized protein isoform X4 n=1 Tax=Bemisia tabaci TaxID=7038 RepID=UPI003B28B869
MMNSGCRSSVCQNERNTCGITRGTKSECSGEGGPGFGRWESPMGRTRSRPTADTQRDERAQICEEILCDGKSQTERREERLVAQEHNVEAHAGTGERHCGVTRNINQHTRTETQWSGAAVTKKDVVCEKIFFTSGAGGKAFKDLGDIDSEATVQTTWSPEGFQLTRTIKKVENFKTNCRGDCSPTPTTQITAPSSKNLQSPKGLQSPVCEAVEIKPFKPLCHHPQDPDHACSPGTAYRIICEHFKQYGWLVFV